MFLFKFLWLMLIGVLIVLTGTAYASTCGIDEVTTFNYPLMDWDETCGFDVTCAHPHHMGVDGVPSTRTLVGASVVAPCTGVVKEARSSAGYGGIVIMECQAAGECVTPFIAHMYANTLQVSPGQNIVKGTVIGYIADSANNGGWEPHIHFGVRKGNYHSFNYTGCYTAPVWSYAGYPYNCYSEMFPDMHDPTNFILTHSETQSADPSDYSSAITDRADLTFQALNPYSGIDNEDTLLHKMGSAINEPHWWFDTAVTYTNGGVARNTVLRDYSGGDKVGVILVHPDSHYAVQLYDKYWYVWAFTQSERQQMDVDVETVNDCNTEWFSQGRGPLSNFGLPITGVYRVGSGLWRQDFQSGYMLWNRDEQKLHLRCYESVTPGWTSEGGWQNVISAAVARAYERNGARVMVGVPVDKGFGAELHKWGEWWIQDYTDGYEGNDSAILVYPGPTHGSSINRASLIRDAFWAYYASNGGPIQFGAPLGDEMDTRKRNGVYTGYDPACDFDENGWNSKEERTYCVQQNCCPDGYCYAIQYTSMQRFQKGVFCYDWESASEVMCNPYQANANCLDSVVANESSSGMGGGGEEDPPPQHILCDPGNGDRMQLVGDLDSWWVDLGISGVDLDDCVANYEWVGVNTYGNNTEATCGQFFDLLETAVNVNTVLWWRYNDGTTWNLLELKTTPSFNSGYCSAFVGPYYPDEPSEPTTECDLHTDGYMRLEGNLTSWWQDIGIANVDINDCVGVDEWLWAYVEGATGMSVAMCNEFFTKLQQAVNVDHLMWWQYTDGSVWNMVHVMQDSEILQFGGCTAPIAPERPEEPTPDDDDVADDDDATAPPPADDDDATTPEPSTINCVLNWDTGAGVWGGEWKLCWAYPWNPSLNTWNDTGGLNDQIQYDWSVWFTFGAASQYDANLTADEFEYLVAIGAVVFSNVNTGEITPWVHADNVNPTPYNDGYLWMLSPSVGSYLIGPSPVSSVNW